MPLSHCLLFFLSTFVLSLIITPLVKKFAIAFNYVAIPKENRWHNKATALLGGVSVFVSMMTVWFLAVSLMGWSAYGRPLPMIICFSAMFVLGLIDDLYNMAPHSKLVGQIVIASTLVFFGYRFGWTDSETTNLLLSIFWVVGITNAYNLLDNMDGLASGIAFIAGNFLFFSLYMGQTAGPLLLINVIYLGAMLGFLIYNFNPASIFLGDSGSLFIGCVIACLAMTGNTHVMDNNSFESLFAVIAIPILILFIPILDTSFVSIMRKLFGRPISKGGKDHSSHRLVAIGFSEKRAVLVLYGFSIVSGLLALAIDNLGFGTSLVVVVLYLLVVIFFWIYLAKVKIYPEKPIFSTDISTAFTSWFIDFIIKARVFDVLLDFILVSIAYYLAYLLRFEGAIGDNFDFFLKSLPIIIACQLFCFYILGVYRGVWSKTGLRDVIVYGKAITAGTILAILMLLFLYRFQSFSRALFVIYWILMLILVSLSRFSFRLLDDEVRKEKNTGSPILVYGAGVGGHMVLNEVETNHSLGLKIIGFIDDNSTIHKKQIQGYEVLGGQDRIEKIIRKYKIKEIIISFKAGASQKREEVYTICHKLGLDIKVKKMRIFIS